MKKLLILMLCICLTVPSLPVRAAKSAADIEKSPIADEILILQDFSTDNHGFKTHGAAPKRTVFQGDSRGIYTMANGFHGMGVLNDKPLEDGTYCFSFDFYAESMSSDMIVRIFNEEQKQIGDSGYGNNSIIFESSGKYKIAKNSYFQTDIRLAGDWYAKRWYSVSVWIDTEMREVKYFINGKEAAFFDLTEQVKQLKGIALFQKGEATDNVYVDNMCFSKVKDITKSVFAPVNVKYSVSDDIIGNNFYADNPPRFDLTLINRLDKDVNAEIYYRTFFEENEFWEKVNKTADTGTLIYTSEKERVELKAGEPFEKELKITETYFGVMTLEVIVVLDGVEYIKEIPYSMTNHTKDMPHNYHSGISSHMQPEPDDPIIGSRRGSSDKIVPLMANAGIGNIRTGGDCGLAWVSVEKTLGQYSLSDDAERLLDLVDKYNIDLVHLYSNTHTAYADPAQKDFDLWRPSMTPEGLRGLTNYLTALMKLAKGRIAVVEVWNEYNHNGGAYKADQKAHAKLIETVYNAVKASDPEVKVIGTNADWWTSIRDGNTTKLLEVINGKKIFDGISIHPYNPTGGVPEAGVTKELSDLIRGDLKRTGLDENMPFYGTELGWSDVKAGDSKGQAANVVRALPLCWWEGSVDIVYHYTEANYGEYYFSGSAESLSEATYGLLNSTNMATDVPYLGKPSYVAMGYYNGLMADGEMLDCMSDEDNFIYKMRDRKGRDVLMMGPIGEKAFEKTFDLGCSKVTVSDMYGNEKEVYGIDGKFTFAADKNEIVYVIGKFTKTEETQPMFACDTASIETPINMESRVKVQAPENFTGTLEAKTFGVDMVGNAPVFKNGNAEMKLKSYSYIPDINSYIMIRAVDGDKLYFEKKIPVTYSSSGMVIGSARWVNNANRTDLWNLSFDVKNIRNDKSINGKLSDTGNNCLYAIPTIAPGETREVVIPIKNLKNVSQIGTFDGLLNFNTGDSTELNLTEHYVAALYADKKPTIDGVLEKGEWIVGDHLTVKINDIDHVFGPGDKNAIWTGPDDLSSVAYLEYDMENLYIAIEVTDNVYHSVYPSNQMYNGDSVQVLIHYDLSPLNTGTEYCIALADGKEATMWRHKQEGNTTGYVGAAASALYTDGQCAISQKGKSTTYEISIPWSKMKFDGGSIKKGQIMGFTYLINDNDGAGRKNWIENGPESCIGSGGKMASKTARMVLLK